MKPLVNIILPTIRFLPVSKDILAYLFKACEANADVHLTIADGQMNVEKRAWIVQNADTLLKDARLTYIELEDPIERMYRAAQIEAEWILLVSDDDAPSVNYVRSLCDTARRVTEETTAVLPRTFVCYAPTQFYHCRFHPIQEPSQQGRLLSLFRQGRNGLATFGAVRHELFQDWMAYVRQKPVWPTYSDQLLVSYLAMKGHVALTEEESVYLKDEGDWHDPSRAIQKDARSYRDSVLTLFHEVFWAADLFEFLGSHGLEADAIPAVMVRAETLLKNGVGSVSARLQILNLAQNSRIRQAAMLVRETAEQATTVLSRSVQEQQRFLEYVQGLSKALHMESQQCYSTRLGQPIAVFPHQAANPEDRPEREEAIPAVSVIIPCYGQAHFLPEAVDSVVSQTYEDWECLIVDDGSPDQTAETACQLIGHYPDKRIRLIRKQNGGLADARNAGISEAKGRYILPLDADDRLHPDYLAETVPVLDTRPEIAIVYVDEQNFGLADHVHVKGVSNLQNLLCGNVHDYCTLYRRSVWEHVGGYSPAMYFGAEDWCFWIAAAKLGLSSYHLEKPLFLYRSRPGTMVAEVQSNMEVVKAQIILHHAEVFTQDCWVQARTLLANVNDQIKSKLDKTRITHPNNSLLQLFHYLAHSRAGREESESWDKSQARLLPTVPDRTSTPVEKTTGNQGSSVVCQGALVTAGGQVASLSDLSQGAEAKWVKLAAFLEHILRQVRLEDPSRTLRIIHVDRERGWLTNKLAIYGFCEHIDPVFLGSGKAGEPSVNRSRNVGAGGQGDVVVCSDVLDHMLPDQRGELIQQLSRLLKPGGYLLLSASRGEISGQWRSLVPASEANDTWMTETLLRELLLAQGYHDLSLQRIYGDLPQLRCISAPTPADLASRNLIPIGQVWACRLGQGSGELSVSRQPMVSVIVATYNRPDRLREALLSILAQSYHDFEVIVVNDGTVDVDAVISELKSDGRITAIKHGRNRGLAAARNTGIRMARGKYLSYLDDDDRYFPNHLATLVERLEQGPYKAAYSDAWRVHEQQEHGHYYETGRDLPYSYDFNPANLLVANYFPVLCVMHERSCLEEVGGFDESLFAHEDWDLWIRIATRFPFVHVKKITAEFTWRGDGSSMTSSTQHTYYRTREIIYRKYRSYAEGIPGVVAAQEQQLAAYHAKVSPTQFACSIIIPVWNKAELTTQCLETLASVTTDVTYEVIVVNNGSTDGTKELLSSLTGDVQIINNQENKGFAKACNQGARVARGRHLVFLNNDTLPKAGWLRALSNEADANVDVGIVGSKLLYPDGTIQHAGVVRDSRRFLPYHAYKSFPGDHPAVNQRRELQAVTAACLLIKRSVFEEVGGFDEGYLNGFEDVDLCLKVRERDYTVVYQPRSVVVHLENQTPGRKAHEEANGTRFLDRWGMQWWAADEDKYFYAGGHKLTRVFRNEQLGADIEPIDDVKGRAAWAHVAAAQTAALKKDWQAVRRELSLVDEWPRDPFVLSWGAMMAERLHESLSRIRFLTRSVDCTNNLNERLALVRTLLEHKEVVPAEEQLGLVFATSPNQADGLLLKGILCMQREQYGPAEDAFASALREGADRRKCLMGMGMAAMGRAYAQGAWERFVEILVDHPNDPEAIHWLLRAGTAQNRWSELGEQLSAYVTRNPSELAIRFALASVYLRGDQIEAARREYDALRADAPAYDGLDQLGQMISGREVPLTMGAPSC